MAGSTRDRAWRLALVVLLAATLLTRIPFLSTVPFNGDSTHYLLGMERFDPVEARPHPPGYPLYVLAGKALWIVVGDPHRALVLLSVAASVVAVWAIVRLGSALGTRAVGLWAGVLLAVNPMFWLHGELALSYSVEIAGAILVALAAWGSYTRPSGRAAVWLALAFAVLGGFRPPVLVLLAPVYLFGLVRLGWRDRALAVGITGAVVLAWLVPLVELSGGVATYVEVARRQGEIAGGQTSPLLGGDWAVWASNISLFAVALVGAVHVVPLVALAAFVRRRPRRISARAALLWLWLAPALLTFVLVHFGQIGYILLPLPPMLLLSLFAIEGAWPAQVASRRPALVLVVCIVASLWFASIALTTLQDNEAAWRQIRAALRTRPPEETLVLARVSGGGSFQAAAWVLQDLRVVGLTGSDEAARGARYEAQGGQWSYQLDHPHPVCQVVALRGARRVAVLDDLLAGWVPDPARWQRIDLPNGEPLLLRDVPPGATVVDLSRGTIELAERDAATC
ncbi:MAG: hypothetical protein QJR03_15585 [Sphaerobacter sp.]|nr:hypothetical protein [Sphaerobacter sp.]